MNPTEQTIAYWETVAAQSEEAEKQTYKAWQDAKYGNVYADPTDIQELYRKYAAALRERNLNVKTLRGLKVALRYSIYHRSEAEKVG